MTENEKAYVEYKITTLKLLKTMAETELQHARTDLKNAINRENANYYNTDTDDAVEYTDGEWRAFIDEMREKTAAESARANAFGIAIDTLKSILIFSENK